MAASILPQLSRCQSGGRALNLQRLLWAAFRATTGVRGQLPCTAARKPMTSGGTGDEGQSIKDGSPSVNPKVAKMQEMLAKDLPGSWDECWREGLTPWDLGGPTPVILQLLQNDTLPKGNALIPGCGTGHDVVAIAGPERYVIGLDISENAIKKSQELFSSSEMAGYFTFLAADFFTWQTNLSFDLVFDYTFFCAINPSMRSAWASKIQDLLKPDGELITLMFPVGDYVGGPPFAVSVSDYESALKPVGLEAVSILDNELAVGPRKGKEMIGRWRRPFTQSLM